MLVYMFCFENLLKEGLPEYEFYGGLVNTFWMIVVQVELSEQFKRIATRFSLGTVANCC